MEVEHRVGKITLGAIVSRDRACNPGLFHQLVDLVAVMFVAELYANDELF